MTKPAAVFFILVLALGGACLAETPADNPAPASAPQTTAPATLKPGTIDIASDHLEVDDQRKLIFLKGGVAVRWEGRVLTCDEAEVAYRARTVRARSGAVRTASDPASARKDDPDVQHEIVSIQARGHVKVTLDNRVLLSDVAVYDAQARVITLSGNPRVWRGKDFLSGERIKVFLDEDRSVVEGGSGERVKLRLHQSTSENKPAKTGPAAEGAEQ